jgi:hypothetical protein
LQELSGGFGDLGTFLTLITIVASKGIINFGTALLFNGIFNLLTVLWFDVPIAVQPMHAIASIAAAQTLSSDEVAAAGIFMGVCLFFLGATNLISEFKNSVPVSIVKGIQLGLGLHLIQLGIGDEKHGAFIVDDDGKPVWFGIDSICSSLLIGLFFLATEHRPQASALLVFTWGVIVSVYTRDSSSGSSSGGGAPFLFGPPPVGFSLPSMESMGRGIFNAALPQLPLTILNSVVATPRLLIDCTTIHSLHTLYR